MESDGIGLRHGNELRYRHPLAIQVWETFVGSITVLANEALWINGGNMTGVLIYTQP